MTVTRPEERPLLSLTPVDREGFRHGTRSYLTCLFKCGNACDHAEPNQTETGHIQDEIAKAVGRRSVLRGTAVGAGALVLSGAAAAGGSTLAAAATAPLAAAGPGGPLARLNFQPVAPNRRDAVVVPNGFDHNVIIRWGDPVVAGAPSWSPYALTLDAVKKTFGYNNDYVSVVPLDDQHALMTVNHEYDDPTLMYPAGKYTQEQIAWFGIYSHGLSVVTIKRGQVAGSWYREKNLAGATKNRRINADTKFHVTGPAAGHALLQTTADPSGTRIKGTLNNCAGGTTPWGTVLSGEENFNQYFNTARDGPGRADADQRHPADHRLQPLRHRQVRQRPAQVVHRRRPVRPRGRAQRAAPVRVDRRDRPDEPDRVARRSTRCSAASSTRAPASPSPPTARPSPTPATTSAATTCTSSSLPTTSTTAAPRPRASTTRRCSTTGTLYVAKLTGNDSGAITAPYDGTGEWIPLTSDTQSFVPGMTVEEVLVFTRHAADLVAPTKMDRPEDVEVNPVNKKVYVALTNNSNRGSSYPADEANPVTLSGTRTSPGAAGQPERQPQRLHPRDHPGRRRPREDHFHLGPAARVR